MRVCLLNDSFPPVIDGVANVVMNYADHMVTDFQADVMVGIPKYPDADYSKYRYQIIPYPSFDTAKVASGYRAGNPLDSKALGLMADFKPEIIHSHSPASATLVGRLLREECSAPMVFTYHTKYDIDIARWTSIKPVEEEIIKAMVRNIEACDEIWTVSRGAGESLKSLGFQGDYRVMDNGVDFEKGRVEQEYVDEVVKDYDLPAGTPVYLFVGRLMTYKGLPLILDALKLVADKGQDFRMVFIGKGPDRELLEKKAAELGIADKCIFVGPVYDRKALRAWNTRADLFLFPSTFDTNGLVVREAAACGLASVLIRDSCAAEGITDGRNGFIIDENAQAMAALLTQVSGDLSHLHQVGQTAMDEIYLSWKECVARAYERYQIVIDMKACGKFQERNKLAMDRLMSLAAHELAEQEKLRRFRKEFFHDFHETTAGMLDNFESKVDGKIDDMLDSISDTREKWDLFKNRIEDKVDHLDEVMDSLVESVAEDIQITMQESKEELEKMLKN